MATKPFYFRWWSAFRSTFVTDPPVWEGKCCSCGHRIIADCVPEDPTTSGCRFCALKHQATLDASRAEEAADRKQVELYKRAIREERLEWVTRPENKQGLEGYSREALERAWEAAQRAHWGAVPPADADTQTPP